MTVWPPPSTVADPPARIIHTNTTTHNIHKKGAMISYIVNIIAIDLNLLIMDTPTPPPSRCLCLAPSRSRLPRPRRAASGIASPV